MRSKKEVLVIFKTHLDVGYTDYAENVVKRYLNEYIPKAIAIGNELKGTDTPFVWTVGSWLVWLALKNDKTGEVEQAIKDGILRWHALPFTTHTELMSVKLFEYGLSISKRLDERFGKKTVGAKMTDVPGHTIGMLPLMKKNGVKFLHLGVNPATPLPKVPPVFRWKLQDDEIVVMYQGDYGEVAEFDDFIVYFAHTGDNLGPQTVQGIKDVYAAIREKYPENPLKISSIDDIAERVTKLPNLPVVDKEIGDTWIHGAGTDPQKMSRYRKLLRKLDELDEISMDLTDNLLCIPEHTWGMCVQLHFPYTEFYTHTELEKMPNERAKIEKSWTEQRNYLLKAEELLGVENEYPIAAPTLDGYTKIEIPKEFEYELSWQIFDNSDYDRYTKTYSRKIAEWVLWDFTKIGLHDYQGGVYTARVTAAYQKGQSRVYKLEFDQAIAEEYGLPYFYVTVEEGKVNVRWFGKKCSRLPQACWFKIKGLQEKWKIEKLGQWIDPNEIIDSPYICGIDSGVQNDDVMIKSLDCGLVAPFGKRLLQYNCGEVRQDLHFNLYNNIWNTNFPMWYTDDGSFTFEILKK